MGRRPTRIDCGISSQRYQRVGDFGGRHGAIERLGIYLVASTDSQSLELIISIKLYKSGDSATPAAKGPAITLPVDASTATTWAPNTPVTPGGAVGKEIGFAGTI
jgi:hypothetical protein